MSQRKKWMRMVAIGLLLIAGSNLVNRMFFSMNDFVIGCLNGIGLGMMLVAIFKMKYRAAK